jgi:hypothetical protein
MTIYFFLVTAENRNFLMKKSVWNAWNCIRKLNPQQTGFGALYASGDYMKYAQNIHKYVLFAEEGKREKRGKPIKMYVILHKTSLPLLLRRHTHPCGRDGQMWCSNKGRNISLLN